MLEDLFQASFQDSFIPQAFIALSGTFLHVNDQFCSLFGKKREDLIGGPVSLIGLPGEEWDIPNLALKIETGSLQNWKDERRFAVRDGSLYWAAINVTLVRTNGVPSAVLVQFEDITLKKQLELDARRSQEDLEQFAYIASHDLREPLTAVAGFGSLLRKRYGSALDETGSHFIDQILDSASRMGMKLDDLLAFSRAGRRMSPQAGFPLGTAIEEAKRSLVRSLAETSAVVETVGELPTIAGDRSMVAQVFQNLFSNSLKYRKKEESPRIVVNVEPQGEKLCLVTVRDNGIGFDMRHKERIFGVFQRLYTNEQYPGTGIGLAITKKIIERHGGTIWTLSTPGDGATFYFTLPVVGGS